MYKEMFQKAVNLALLFGCKDAKYQETQVGDNYVLEFSSAIAFYKMVMKNHVGGNGSEHAERSEEMARKSLIENALYAALFYKESTGEDKPKFIYENNPVPSPLNDQPKSLPIPL